MLRASSAGRSFVHHDTTSIARETAGGLSEHRASRNWVREMRRPRRESSAMPSSIIPAAWPPTPTSATAATCPCSDRQRSRYCIKPASESSRSSTEPVLSLNAQDVPPAAGRISTPSARNSSSSWPLSDTLTGQLALRVSHCEGEGLVGRVRGACIERDRFSVSLISPNVSGRNFELFRAARWDHWCRRRNVD